MTLQVARGLFRLWLVLSVLWIGGVGVVTWPAFDPAKRCHERRSVHGLL
jgi:hypothetical protein